VAWLNNGEDDDDDEDQDVNYSRETQRIRHVLFRQGRLVHRQGREVPGDLGGQRVPAHITHTHSDTLP
jgi:hypothetical protein